MKKIGILSMQEVDNYGSVLQAYSLKKIINGLGCNVEFLAIKSDENEVLNSQCGIDNSKTSDNSWLNRQWSRLLGKIEREKLKKLFSDFRSSTGLNSLKNDGFFDVCVIGSDEVFNCLQKSKWGFSSQLFGDVKSAKKVITYAASCGSTKAENLTNELRVAVKKAMSNLSAISVRDNNTADFVQAVSEKEIIYNLDPVAVGNFDDEIRDIKVNSKLPKKYCIVYSYTERICDEKEIKAISEYCKSNGLKMIAPFGRQKWIHACKPLTPFELLKAFQNAECIVTDTFHGTLFGAKFGERLAVLIRESNRNKLEDLTERLQIQDHVITDPSQLSVVLEKKLNKKKINEILSSERNRTLDYLKENL